MGGTAGRPTPLGQRRRQRRAAGCEFGRGDFESSSRARLLPIGLGIASLLALSCASGMRSTRPPSRAVRGDAVAARPVAPAARSTAPARLAPRLPADVRVRLGFAQGARSLEFDGTAQGRLSVRAENAALVINSRRIVGPFVVQAATEGAGITLGGRTYPGHMILEALPAGGLAVLNVVDIESYVEGVVAAELVLWSAKPAELKAQSIAARTYAARRIAQQGGAGVELADGTQDQAYGGLFLPAATDASRKVAARLQRAVRATRGQLLVKDEALLDARFHASCGGRTAAFGDIFDKGGPGTTGAVCEPCMTRARRERSFGEVDKRGPLVWQHRLESAQVGALARRFGIGQQLRYLSPARVDAGGRWLAVKLTGDTGTKEITFGALRAALGYTALKSAQLSQVRPAPGQQIAGRLVFEGLGRGHGVGLCQEGCRDYAARGWTAAQILAHYYPGSTIKRF